MMKGRRRGKGVASSKLTLAFGNCGIKSLDHAWVSSRQIEAARRVMTRYIKKGGKIWIRIFPDKPITQKGAEMPMGKGKGAVDHYIAVVKPGMVLLEMDGVAEKVAKEAMKLATFKLPVRTKFILR